MAHQTVTRLFLAIFFCASFLWPGVRPNLGRSLF